VYGFHGHGDSTAFLELLASHPGCNAQLAAGGDLRHDTGDFIKLQRYNERSRGVLHAARGRTRASNKSIRVEGGLVDQQLKQLMKELGEAINESLAESDQIAEVVSRIKEGGYDIFLVLEATIGVSKPGEKANDKTSLVTTLTGNPEFKVNDQDLKFLKSLRIKIEDDAA
jgi:hypothetical protein